MALIVPIVVTTLYIKALEITTVVYIIRRIAGESRKIMTKREQTDEMTKERNEIKDIMKLLDKCVSLNPMCKSEVASVLYGNNYRKLPKDSIVLSRKEYEMLKRR